jgi:hypothetical protein
MRRSFQTVSLGTWMNKATRAVAWWGLRGTLRAVKVGAFGG